MSQPFRSQPPETPNVLVSADQPHVLLVTLDRPKQLNALPRQTHLDLARLWQWYDDEPSLRCAVVTGSGRAFCAGADLKEWHNRNDNKHSGDKSQGDDEGDWTDNGFAGISNRRGKKPVIAAVNGLCFGGGMELALNADLVLASPRAQFGLPEVSRGVVALAGALPRLMRSVGRQRAAEMALLGRRYSAAQMHAWGLVNYIVEGDGNESVVREALRWAEELAGNSPDAVIVSREGLLGGWDGEDPRASTARVGKGIYRELEGGENMREGVLSFVERRKPVWKDGKL